MRVVGAKGSEKTPEITSPETKNVEQETSKVGESENIDNVSKEDLLDLLLNDEAVTTLPEIKESENVFENSDSSEEKSNIDDDIEQTLRELEELLKMESEDDDDKKED
jgi:hypothetical protein